jgi:hypothetical protein
MALLASLLLVAGAGGRARRNFRKSSRKLPHGRRDD